MIDFDGLFFDEKNSNIIYSLDVNRLDNKVYDLHVTLNRFPDRINDNLIGKRFNIELIGYASDGMNSGFKVNLPKEILNYYNNFDGEELITPHITTSYKDGSSLKHTKDLDFVNLSNPVIIEAYYSYKEKNIDKKRK